MRPVVLRLRLVVLVLFVLAGGAAGFPVGPSPVLRGNSVGRSASIMRLSPEDHVSLITFVSGQCVGMSCAVVFSKQRTMYKNMLLTLRDLIALIDLWPTDL